jgi:hypothetical protein
VWKLDRLSRSLRDVLTIMERLGEAKAGFGVWGAAEQKTGLLKGYWPHPTGIPLSAYGLIFRVPEYSERWWRPCSGVWFHREALGILKRGQKGQERVVGLEPAHQGGFDWLRRARHFDHQATGLENPPHAGSDGLYPANSIVVLMPSRSRADTVQLVRIAGDRACSPARSKFPLLGLLQCRPDRPTGKDCQEYSE